METAALQKDILTETYEDIKSLIFDTVWRFIGKYGGNIDDLMAEANLIFIECVDEYDETKAKFPTWLTNSINYGLLDYIKKEYKQTHISIDREDTKIEPESPSQFSMIELLDEMQQDGLIILKLFLETPTEVIQNVLDEGKRLNHIQGFMRTRLRNRLRQMGWTLQRITESFEEIKTVIQC